MPNDWRRYRRASSPSATRAAVSRALARSSTGLASWCPYFCIPARSAWPGRGRVSGAARPRSSRRPGGHRVGRHHRVPLGPLGVADADRDRPAERHAVPHAAGDLRLVLLELHPRAPAVPGPAPGQRGGHVRGADLDARGQAFADRDERPPVRLSRGQPAQHDADPPTNVIMLRRPLSPGRRPDHRDLDPAPQPRARAPPAARSLARCAASVKAASAGSQPGTGTRHSVRSVPSSPGSSR